MLLLPNTYALYIFTHTNNNEILTLSPGGPGGPSKPGAPSGP